MHLDANDRTLRDVLNTHYFVIPRFQRPYSWEIEQIEEFWEDAVANTSSAYFIGTMVVHKINSDTVSVIDGQQRLTTLMMLLCVIRDVADKNKEESLANGTHTFVERKDENNDLRFVLKTETSYPYLQDEVLSRGAAELGVQPGAEEKVVKAAYDRLRRYVDGVVESIDRSKASPDEKQAKIRDALKSLRDRVLGLLLIIVEVGDLDSATTIFVTMNSRGKDLEPSDLVKAHLLTLLPKRSALDKPLEKWESVVDLLDQNIPPLDHTDFLLASWRSRYGATTQKKLHKAVHKSIKQARASQFLDELVCDVKIYRDAIDPGNRTWTREAKDAQHSLKFLRDFGIRQPMPLLVSALREYSEKRIRVNQLKRLLRAVEDYHFTWNVMAHKSSSGGISQFYGKAAREILSCEDKKKRGQTIDSIVLDLRKKRPSEVEFVESTKRLWLTNDKENDKKVVQYILARMYRHNSETDVVDFSRMTIEHLMPQSSKSDHVGRIGNLIMISESLNTKLDNKMWSKKQQILKQIRNEWIPEDILKDSVWNDESIQKRTDSIARLAYRNVWTG